MFCWFNVMAHKPWKTALRSGVLHDRGKQYFVQPFVWSMKGCGHGGSMFESQIHLLTLTGFIWWSVSDRGQHPKPQLVEVANYHKLASLDRCPRKLAESAAFYTEVLSNIVCPCVLLDYCKSESELFLCVIVYISCMPVLGLDYCYPTIRLWTDHIP